MALLKPGEEMVLVCMVHRTSLGQEQHSVNKQKYNKELTYCLHNIEILQKVYKIHFFKEQHVLFHKITFQ